MFRSIIILGIASFSFCLFLHILLWRMRRPKNDFLALFFVFLFFPIGFCTACFLFFYVNNIDPNAVIPLKNFFAVLLLHVSLSSVYIQTYPSAQAVSPSLEILRLVGASMPRGLNKQEILLHFDKADIIFKRIEDLSNSKFIRIENDRLALTCLGKFLAKFFIFYRFFLALPPGKG